MSASPPPTRHRISARWLWLAALVMVVLHHDFWWYGDTSVVLGFLPVGLAYHVAYSVVAAGLWIAAIRYAWPHELEAWADHTDDAPTRTHQGQRH